MDRFNKGGGAASAGRALLGRPSDWLPGRPRMQRWRPSLASLGPIAVLASTLVGWFAFAGATGDGGNVAFGLFIGSASIVLMAWSFLLAVRIRILEPLFGGLDRMYRVHRWAGVVAVVAMFLHTSIEPEIEGGVRGASKSLANTAEDLAGTGEIMLYVLVALSILRWMPYRWWRWTHKLLGIPFAFACFHFFTAEKPYANGSAWGIWFGGLMLAGLGAWVARVAIRDTVRRGTRHTVASIAQQGGVVDLRLAPVGAPIDHAAGQFAVVKIQLPGLSEPHPFTIASAPGSSELRFLIKDLGDWSERLQTADIEGATVIVEGPFGRFDPVGHSAAAGPPVWVAGGVGITPFLSTVAQLPDAPAGERPLLFMCISERELAVGLDDLEAAAASGRIDLEVCCSGEGRRFSSELLVDTLAGRDLSGVHVAACGPTRLLDAANSAARSCGATHVEVEEFDIRGGIGPDMSRQVAALIGR